MGLVGAETDHCEAVAGIMRLVVTFTSLELAIKDLYGCLHRAIGFERQDRGQRGCPVWIRRDLGICDEFEPIGNAARAKERGCGDQNKGLYPEFHFYEK